MWEHIDVFTTFKAPSVPTATSLADLLGVIGTNCFQNSIKNSLHRQNAAVTHPMNTVYGRCSGFFKSVFIPI